MTEWADEGGAGLNPAHSCHPHDDGEKLQRHLDNDQHATSDEAQHDNAETLCPPPAAVGKPSPPSPVLRVMVDGEWVPLKVECQWWCWRFVLSLCGCLQRLIVVVVEVAAVFVRVIVVVIAVSVVQSLVLQP
jgi:hypothetical protein